MVRRSNLYDYLERKRHINCWTNTSVVDPNRLCSDHDPDPDPGSHVHLDPDLAPGSEHDPDPT